MTDDFEESIRERASPPADLTPYIEEIGFINTKTEGTKQTIYDFFLGPDDTPAFERFDNGRFGGTAIVEDGQVKKATIRVGDLEIDRGADPVLPTVRIEELVEQQDPPVDVEVDLGDFEQGIPHLRFTAPADGGVFGSGVPVDEFGRFMVDAVKAIRENKPALKEIAAGERFEL